jgi:hypothetical protein
LTRVEIFDYSSEQVTGAATPEFEHLAATFFKGHGVPEVIDTSKPIHGPKGFNITYFEGDRGKVLKEKPMKDPKLVCFLQDVMLANGLEEAALDPKLTYFNMKVIRHHNYNSWMSAIGPLEKSGPILGTMKKFDMTKAFKYV